MRTIALITDFGEKDYYVGAVKGVILSINPDARIVDVTHEAIPFHPISAAYILMGVMNYFPRDTIFLTVVDPRVGTDRKILLISADGKYYIGPDNGVFAPVYQHSEIYTVYDITAEHLFLTEGSHTFEARDKMAPIAAWLSKGLPVERLGEPTENYRKFKFPQPKFQGNIVSGIVIHIDRFGNLALNIKPEDLGGRNVAFAVINDIRISRKVKTFDELRTEEVGLLVNSLGFFEIGAKMHSAKEVLKVSIGEPVQLILA